MKLKALALGALSLAAVAAAPSAASARDTIQIVGSSTVFPFSTAVAEHFGKTTKFNTPVVESTGSGGGLKLFCSGVGEGHPDITNASRRIKAKEVAKCAAAGINDIVEVKVGFDGIVMGNAINGPAFALTKKDIFLALAKDVPVAGGLGLQPNPYKMWSEVNPDLPNVEIQVMGPPPTSGTRDAFVELAMEGGAKAFPFLKALRKEDKKKFKAIAHAIREDGVYEEAGENDNLIVNKLGDRPSALGIFGFSFLDQNGDKIKGATVGGVAPTFDNIAGGEYGVSRSLYFYVKKAHVGSVPGIQEFIEAFTDEAAWGNDGYLADKGLIPLPAADREKIGTAARNLETLPAGAIQ